MTGLKRAATIFAGAAAALTVGFGAVALDNADNAPTTAGTSHTTTVAGGCIAGLSPC
jgi:hypothetical protein